MRGKSRKTTSHRKDYVRTQICCIIITPIISLNIRIIAHIFKSLPITYTLAVVFFTINTFVTAEYLTITIQPYNICAVFHFE